VKGIFLLFFFFTVVVTRSQPHDHYLFFSGYIFDEDSIPIENAVLINFRTLKSDVTNKEGFFQLFVDECDSLLINHISYERRIVKANSFPANDNKYYLALSSYELRTVSINYREIMNLQNTMNEMKRQMKENTPVYRTGTEYNSYAPEQPGRVAGINIVELYNWIKTIKYRKSTNKEE
jgi:hypothetical protein